METIFPQDTGFVGFFAVGFRKAPGTSETQRVGTVILKRTYDITPRTPTAEGSLTPSAEPLPILTEDEPDNRLINGDFELSEEFEADGATTAPGAWDVQGGVAAGRAAGGVSGRALRLTGAAGGRATQSLAFAEPLGGRRFRFSFSARAGVTPARLESARLEADGQTLCAVSADLTAGMVRRSATGVWPADLEATEMLVALPIAFDPGDPTAARETFYDRVQVEERQRLTEWDDSATLRREHDLAPYKEESDIVVLEYAAASGAVRVNDANWLRDPAMSTQAKALFGWEPRVDTDREDDAGTFSTNADDYPPEWPVPAGQPGKDPLPADFDNAFYNAYGRDAHVAHAPSYLSTTDVIEIERNGVVDYAFRLHGETIAATCRYYSGSGPDAETRWKWLSVPMRLDTLVIEPEIDRCYALWRGVWDYDSVAEDAYRRLTVTAS